MTCTRYYVCLMKSSTWFVLNQIMELAHLGEARAGSKCGRMDQCCALGGNHVAAMFFDGEDVRIYEV